MGKKIIMVDDIEVEKHNFHQHKILISIYDVNIDRIVVSNKVRFGKRGFKCFIECKDYSEKFIPLQYMSFLMTD